MVTIIIPTKNRSDFLIRLLNYYANTGYQHWIYIGDSSDSYHARRTIEAVKGLEGQVKIMYRQYPASTEFACLKNLLETVTTPYAVYIADDDFLITSGIERCIEFLENNKEYTGANGQAILFSLKSSGAKGEFSFVRRYKQSSVEADTATKRLSEYLSDSFVTQFSIQRTDVWRRMYKDVLSIPDREFAGELLPCCLAVLQGKIKHLDCFYLVRQAHSQRYLLRDTYDWITHPDWPRSSQVFQDSLVQDIVDKDNIAKEQAHEVVKQAFWLHMNSVLNLGFQQRYNLPRSKRIKKSISRIPILGRIVQKIKSLRFFSNDISISTFLDRNSPHYDDFVPLYQVVTGEGKQ